jgi:hypothetical protein
MRATLPVRRVVGRAWEDISSSDDSWKRGN